jgi:hypothetical protein
VYLASMIHRDRLFRVATRWLADSIEPGDGRFVTELFIYEFIISSGTVRRFMQDILQLQSRETPRPRRLFFKDELRRAIVEACRDPTPRTRELLRRFASRPEEFFPRTPTNLLVATHPDGALAAMLRFKSIRRLAEKASRRIADRLSDEIRAAALSLADARARAAGVALPQLVTPPEAMAEEFASAERTVSHSFKDRRIVLEPHQVWIDDVIGMKFVGRPEELERIERGVREHPHARVVERTVHEGTYCDIQLLVDLQLPPVSEIVERHRGRDWSAVQDRGLPPDVLEKDFPGYVETGDRTFRCEIILTTFDELVESEFGRSMHEERILVQRGAAPYRGRIARNASFIIEYLLMLAISPTVEVAALPVKMWGRYLEDAFSAAVWMLFGVYRQGLTGSFEPELARVVDEVGAMQ